MRQMLWQVSQQCRMQLSWPMVLSIWKICCLYHIYKGLILNSEEILIILYKWSKSKATMNHTIELGSRAKED